MKVAVYSSNTEVIILAVDNNDQPIGEKVWFERGGRWYDDYDLNIVNLPVHIKPSFDIDMSIVTN